MNRTARTAEAQLERILYILPAAARGGSVPIADIARALGVDDATVLRDLEDATARSYYHPAGAVESFSITTDGRTVQVHAPQEFRRPVRLNQREALALGLGLRALAADAQSQRRGDVLALATRLEAALSAGDATDVAEASVSYGARPAPPPAYGDTAVRVERVAEDSVEYDALALAFDDDGFRGVVADAVTARRICTIWYLKPGDAAPMHRRIAPHRLIHARGMWYVAALDMERAGLRFFRMDRVLDAALTDEAAPDAPAELEAALANGAPYYASDEIDVRVRYSPRVARWVVEHAPHAQLEHDGSALLQHRVADPKWIVRHVLQYGGEANVEEPAQARGWVEHALRKVLAS